MQTLTQQQEDLKDETFTFTATTASSPTCPTSPTSPSPPISLTVAVRKSTSRTSNFKLTVQVSRRDLFNSLTGFGGAPWSSSSDEDEDAPAADIDALGLDVWPAAITLCQYLVDMPERVENKRVIELGAGVGLPGMVAAKLGAAESVVSDYDAAVVGHAVGVQLDRRALTRPGSLTRAARFATSLVLQEEQLGRCGLQGVARAAIVDWKKPVEEGYRDAFDVVMAADVLYMSFLVPDLLKTCWGCLKKPGGRVLLTHQCRQSLVRDGDGEMVVVDRDVSFEAFKEAVASHAKLAMRVVSEMPLAGFPGPMTIIELTPRC